MTRMRLFLPALLYTTALLSAQGTPPRASASDYQTQGKAGDISIAAEFLGHSVPTSTNILSSEEYVVVEAALYGAADARLKLSLDDFSLRINGKKTPLPAQPYELVFKSIKDPDLEPPASEKKSKGGLNTSGGGNGNEANLPPPVVHIPIGVQRAMEQRVQKASLQEGERALPQAGLVYFQYRGKPQSIRSVELIYSGPAGKLTLPLQP